MKTRLLLGCALVAMACGIRRVPDAIIEKLPYEARIELLEAENDLALAVDRLDEAHNEVMRTKELIHRGKDRLGAAQSEVSAAADALSREVAELAVVEGDARVQYLRAKQRLNVKEEDLAALFVRCAYTRFEQSRLTAARKAKLEGSEALDPAEFDAQVKACDTKHDEAKAEMKETKDEARTLRTSWDETREKLAKKTFDARASPYVE
jgi:hypothetical protein